MIDKSFDAWRDEEDQEYLWEQGRLENWEDLLTRFPGFSIAELKKVIGDIGRERERRGLAEDDADAGSEAEGADGAAAAGAMDRGCCATDAEADTGGPSVRRRCTGDRS
jgi:hypothetical protein